MTTSPFSYDLSIHGNPDAAAWAKFFCETWTKLYPDVPPPPEDWMQSWFANAMMAMHVRKDSDEPKSNEPERKRDLNVLAAGHAALAQRLERKDFLNKPVKPSLSDLLKQYLNAHRAEIAGRGASLAVRRALERVEHITFWTYVTARDAAVLRAAGATAEADELEKLSEGIA